MLLCDSVGTTWCGHCVEKNVDAELLKNVGTENINEPNSCADDLLVMFNYLPNIA